MESTELMYRKHEHIAEDSMRATMVITNNGPDIKSTNFWLTERARAGLCYLTGNAGALRLLVPAPMEHALTEMGTGKFVLIKRSQRHANDWDIVFDDESDAPFVLTISNKQVDRKLEHRRMAPFTVWTSAGKQLSFFAEIEA